MKKLSYFLMYLGILVVTTSVLISTSLYNEVLDMSGTYGMNKISLKVKDKNKDVFFTPNNIEDLKKDLETQDVAFSSKSDAFITYKDRIYDARIVGVNYRYKDYESIKIKFGNFFTSLDETNNTNTALIGSDLALNIFNTDKVVGNEIELYGKEFEIIGVFESHGTRDRNGVADKNIIERLTDDGVQNVYITIDKLIQIGNISGIDYLQVPTDSNGTLDQYEDKIKTAVQALGKNINNYKITDFNKTKALITQLPQLLIFILGCITIIYSLRYIKRKFSLLFKEIKDQISDYYLIIAIKNNLKRIITFVFMTFVILLLSIVMWQAIKLNLYISPEYIPEELIDIKYYSDIIKDKVIQHNVNIGFTQDINERKVDVVLHIEQILFILSLFVGMTAIYISLTQMKHIKEPPESIAVNCSIAILLSILIALIISIYLGISFSYNIKFLVIFCVFLMCMVLNMTSRTFSLISTTKSRCR